ncbi:hypothetical protein [Deinococcus peraridilitoris]|uniref:hypothetical protein n=1 Tax=Deinococcus peraridilitoris TaxID=432329 RepID=UPI000300685B|nr:hypothetical protein [Deinococcus peraridilitoris]
MNTTPLVSPIGQVMLIVLMFLGRIGPLTFAIALARRQHGPRVRYPEDKSIIIG